MRLGPDDSRPELSTASWLAILFAGGMGAGLGGTSICIELNGGGGLAELVHKDTSTALFAFLGYMPTARATGA